MNRTIKIEGLDCANCARELEEEIENIAGVKEAVVDFVGQKVIVDCDEETLDKVICCCNHFEEVKVIEEREEVKLPAVGSAVNGKRIKIKNLCCANCGRELEEELNAIDGVSATVDFMNMTVVLAADSPEAHEKAIYAITHFEDV